MRKIFITFFYVGNIPKAPGSFASIIALPFALVILLYLPASTLFLVGILLFIIGSKIITQYEIDTNTHDDKSIVIDEVAGLFIAVSISPATTIPLQTYIDITDFNNLSILIPVIMSLIYFRLFDIFKPSIIGRIDRNIKNGWGVMGDDIVAGIAAGISSAITWEIIKKISNSFL